MSKYKIKIKTAGWEKEEIPDQLFIPRKHKVDRKPGQLDFDPNRFKPVVNRRGVPKPEGGLWTSDYDSENDTSPWNEWLIENMPMWVPKGDTGLILRPDSDRVRAYHINDVDDYLRLQRDYPAYHPSAIDEDGNPIPGEGLETINFPQLFDPKEQGGAGLHALRVNQDGLSQLGDELRYWDIPSTVWTPGSPLTEVGKMNPGRDLWKRYEEYNPVRRSSKKNKRTAMKTLLQKLAEIEKRGLYHYSDYLFSRIAQSDTPEELNEIEKDVKSDLTDPDIDPKKLNRIQQLIESTKFHMLSVGNDAKTPKGLKSGYITGILYLEPGSSEIFDINAFEEYKEKNKKSGNTTQLWQKFKQEAAPHSTKTTCTHASPSCLKDCIYHTGRGGIDNVQAAREMKTSKLFHPNTRDYAMALIEMDINNLITLCKNLNVGFGLNVQPVVRLNGTTDINWAKEAAKLHREFPTVNFYDYTKVPKFMDMYLRGENPYTGEPFAPNYHMTFSRSESNRTEALGFLERGGNVAIVFDQIPETLTYHGKTYRVISGDRHDLRFLDDVEGMKQPGEGLVIGLKYKRPIGKEKREQKVQRQKVISPMFQKLDMASEGSAEHEAPFVIQTNGEKHIVIG